MYVLVIENKSTGTDHFSVGLKNVKKFTSKTTTITETFKKKSGINLIVMIKWI